MKKYNILQRPTLSKGCPSKTFKILKTAVFLMIVTALNVFGVNETNGSAADLQQIRITGTVTDAAGVPMPGVNIQVEGTTI